MRDSVVLNLLGSTAVLFPVIFDVSSCTLTEILIRRKPGKQANKLKTTYFPYGTSF